MKIGDTVWMGSNFKIDSYDSRMLSIHTIYNGQIIYLKIPVFISSMGIRCPENDYAYPSHLLPKDHPDYYELESIGNKAVYFVDGWLANLKLGEDFNITGEYRFTIVDEKREDIVRYAKLRKAADRLGILEDYFTEGGYIDGGLLIGKLIRIILFDNGEPVYFNSVSSLTFVAEKNNKINEITDLIGVIQDQGSYIEYHLPIKLMVSK